MTVQEILKNGFLEVRIKVAGMIQRHKFIAVKENTPLGTVTYLECKASVPLMELTRLAQEYQLPFRSKLGTAFPAGKSSKDFVGL